ncbi:glycoside hydrolase family 55 protein [Pedobacter sp. MC2016-14]|uniref:glycoside hydrolase family 55 protein n=1 Tax=Pedobacter sp. MC2016-14 TaxID=2897327 RepID=UPI001E60B90A|nr:glycoside hydrolase family 55 protein [Pedobacter sp. MC2016-14]MCD0490343.1 glycoside hydrolase family 55 protein [Pedobacter sp. MC2016-14]
MILRMLFLFLSTLLYSFSSAHINRSGPTPVIYQVSESAAPGETIALQGYGFGSASIVWLSPVNGTEKVLKPQIKLAVLTGSAQYAAAKIPSDISIGLYAVWIESDHKLSNPVFINRARAVTYEFNEIMPGTILRLFGRNLSLGSNLSTVKFILADNTGQVHTAKVLKANAFEIQLKAPENLIPGKSYQISLNNGYGDKYGEAIFDEKIAVRKTGDDPFKLEVPWAADFNFNQNVYNVKTDPRLKQKATGNGGTNDRNAIQEAIDKASINGGVVYLPSGTYKLFYSTGSGITMRSRVVLKGDGPDQTKIIYGYGAAFSTERVKAPYGWTLGWPDSRAEGMAMVWPGGITTSGLLDLSMQNVNEYGDFVHNIKNMPEGGSKLMMKNCSFDFNTGWGLAMVNVDQLLITGCTFKSITQSVRNINAPTRTWPWDLKNSHHIIFKNNKHFYTAGRFGANGCHHAIFENNFFLRDGDHQAEGETGGLSLDYTADVVIQANTFDVSGAPIKSRNQGETILSQGGNAHQQNVGTITSATSTSITDKKKEFQDLTDRVSTDWQYAVHPTNYAIVIVSGKGAGQWRTATGNNDTTITIDKAWDVIPEPGSRYVVTQWSAYQMLIKNNILKGNNRGIWFYSGLCEVDIIDNKLINSEGIYIRADQRLLTNRYNLTRNGLIKGNQIIDTDGRRPAYINIWLTQSKAENLIGIGASGMEVRNNFLQANLPNVTSGFVKTEGYINYAYDSGTKIASSNGDIPGILGSIFENNTAVNTDNAYQIGAAAHHTVIANSINNNVNNAVSDAVNSHNKGSFKTYITPAKK